MAEVVRCPTCGEPLVAAAGTSFQVEPSAGAVEQAAIDRDETAESRDRAAERRDRGADDRDVLTRRHQRSAFESHALASDGDQTWSDHDQTSSLSDQEAADADQRAADAILLAGGEALDHQRGVLARDRSRRNRGSVTASREQTTAARVREDEARTDGGDGLEFAEHDRADAASDRQEAARDREAARLQRIEAAAAALRAAQTLEAMSDGFFTLDPDGRFTYLNPQGEKLLKRRDDDVLGKLVRDVFSETAESSLADACERALREQVTVRVEDTYRPLGRTFEARVHPVADGLAVYFTDVTDERLRDDRLRQAQRLEAIGRVTASVAHDFNNVLTAIGGFASLGQETSDPTTGSCFAHITSASQRAAALTKQLLVFAREQQLAPTVINLNDVISDLAPLLQQLLPTGIELSLQRSPKPFCVFVDRSQLERVLVNLVVNSRDAIQTTGTITVTTTPDQPRGAEHDLRGPCGWLQVKDTGAGIPEEVLPLIFDPFFSTKAPEMGTGLGLATIYGIVSQSGGTIIVDSTVDVGTTMTIALPTQRPRDASPLEAPPV